MKASSQRTLEDDRIELEKRLQSDMYVARLVFMLGAIRSCRVIPPGANAHRLVMVFFCLLPLLSMGRCSKTRSLHWRRTASGCYWRLVVPMAGLTVLLTMRKSTRMAACLVHSKGHLFFCDRFVDCCSLDATTQAPMSVSVCGYVDFAVLLAGVYLIFVVIPGNRLSWTMRECPAFSVMTQLKICFRRRSVFFHARTKALVPHLCQSAVRLGLFLIYVGSQARGMDL